MKRKFYQPFVATCICSLFFLKSFSQVNLPYTLNFSSNDVANWADGIAQDGDGGTSKINGMTIRIYAAVQGTSTLYPASTMIWHNNGYYASNTPTYNGLTPGPDIDVTMDGIPSIVIKSLNPANNFSLTNVRMYDWGGWPDLKITTYDNGSLVGSVNVNFPDLNAKTLTQASGLTPAVFQNVDEIRFTPIGLPVFWLSLNNIGLASPTVLPINLSSFNAAANNDGSVLLQWVTEQEQNSDHFDIEQSTDGNSFVKIGETAAKGNSSIRSTYQYNCVNAPEGKLYYRLKQVDRDGKATYSKTETVAIASKTKWSFYPNPTKDILHITTGDIIKQVNVYNSAGNLVLSAAPKSFNAAIDLSALRKAIYFIDVVTNKETVRQTVYKD